MMTQRMLRALLVGVAVLVCAVIVWVDLSTDLWQKYVVMSGLAGGLVTFVLSALVIDRMIARSAHERWAPVTVIALGDLRRRLAADPESHVPGRARRLPDAGGPASLDGLMSAAAEERDALAAALARWASFLAASADVAEIMDGVAEVADRLDLVIEVARSLHPVAVPAGRPGLDAADDDRERLTREVDRYHRVADELISHIERAIAEERSIARARRT